jgi:RND family efflux transporter MFP subunit
MKRPPLAASLPLTACLLLAGCRQAPPPEETPPAPVKAQGAVSATFGEWTELVGATQPLPDRIARITAPVEGHVVSVLTDENANPVREGQRVEKNQLIVQLDERAVRAQIAELGETAKQAEVAVQLAKLKLDSLTKLTPGGGTQGAGNLVPEIELKQARFGLDDAESKKSGVAAKEKTLKVQLEFHQLRAPIAGVLGPIQVVRGQTLAIGAVVADVTDLSEIDVVSFAPPRLANKLHTGDAAWFKLDKTGPKGSVVFISDQAQPDTGNVLVKVRFKNETKLRANHVARVQVETEAPTERKHTIPESVLMEDQDPPLVVVAEDVQVKQNPETKKDENIGKAKRLRAQLGLRDRSKHVVELLGLSDLEGHAMPLEGWMFITEGGHGLRDGDPVKVTLQQGH